LENMPPVAEHAAILCPRASAHMFWKTGAGCLMMDELGNRLRSISERQCLMLEQVCSFLAHFDQVIGRNGAEGVPCVRGFPHVHLHHAAVDLSNFRNRFASIEVNDVIGVQGFVGFSPAERVNR
ncbi:MAG: hypothetical protein ACK55Z_33520, partial [bacterium]